MKIKKGDLVRVTSGKDKGKEGKVTQVLPEYGKVVVEGLNETTKHLKSRGNQQGQRISYNAPIQASNLRVLSGKTAGRVGYEVVEKGEKRVKNRVVRKAKKQEALA